MRFLLEFVGILTSVWGVGALCGWFVEPMGRAEIRALDQATRLRQRPGIEVEDPLGGGRRVMYTSGGALADMDAGPGRTLLRFVQRHFVERNGKPGFQDKQDGRHNTHSHNSSRLRRDYSRFSNLAYRVNKDPSVRWHYECVMTVADGSERQVFSQVLGPGIRLSGAETPWFLLWQRSAGGPTVEWREAGSDLELRVRPGDGRPLGRITLVPALELSRESAGEHRVLRIPSAPLRARTKGSKPQELRCHIRYGPVAPGVEACDLHISLMAR